MSRVQKRSCYVLKRIQYNSGNFIKIAYWAMQWTPPHTPLPPPNKSGFATGWTTVVGKVHIWHFIIYLF